jgi:phosphatidylserine/phosphatidylglycerophosphate/cardiolipin synthase-like enzyme
VVPLYPDLDGWSRRPELLGRRRAMLEMLDVAPERVLFFGIENHEGTPVYVHAKTCIVDDTWATIGSDNFNRRSWTHDSELSAVMLDEQGVEGGFGQRLRLTLAAEHLDRTVDDDSLLDVMSDCVHPDGLVAAFSESAARLDTWHEGGQVGERPPGRLRRMRPPALGPVARALSLVPYLAMHDPDGRPRSLKRSGGF